MNKRFSYDNMLKSRSIEPSDIIRTFKLDRCCDFMEEKYNNPKLTQKEICNQQDLPIELLDDIEMIFNWIVLIEYITTKRKLLDRNHLL